MQLTTRARMLALSASALFFSSPAMAHHPLGGLPMETFSHGLLSGVAHPVLGFDHLACAVIVGVCALRTGAPKLAPLGYIGAVLAGCLLAPLGVSLPLTELLVALSLLALGAVVVFREGLSLAAAMATFAFFGFFHGSALGESLTGSEGTAPMPVLIGYLLGLGLVQYAVSVGVASWIQSRVSIRAPGGLSADLSLRLAGATVAGIGLFLTAENLEALVMSSMSVG